jgi:hypothetical protein
MSKDEKANGPKAEDKSGNPAESGISGYD